MEHAASRTNWESSAATYNGQSDRLGDRSPASPSTSAGPTACQAVTTRSATRPSRSEPRAYSSRLPTTIPAATARGTSPTGSTNSIGTKISCVGTAEPVPTSKSSRNAAAYAPTRMSTAKTPGLRWDGMNTAISSATATKPPAKTANDRSSLRARR
jgi:hypothetical protein